MSKNPKPLRELRASVREVAPVSLIVHPILHNHPQWDDNSEEFDSFCLDISRYGIEHPICVDHKNRIVDGRQRWRAAKRLKLETVPVQTVPEDMIPELILHYIFQRRHYTKGALAYMSLPIISEAYAGGSKSLEIIVQEFGFSVALFKQARKLREIFTANGDLGEQYRQEIEAKVLSGEIALGPACAGFAGLQSTGGKPKHVRTALDLWDRSFNDLQRRFETWDKFDPESKATVTAKLNPLVEAMPDELLTKLQARVAAELKHRKDNH